jgi:hypothetical protein
VSQADADGSLRRQTGPRRACDRTSETRLRFHSSALVLSLPPHCPAVAGSAQRRPPHDLQGPGHATGRGEGPAHLVARAGAVLEPFAEAKSLFVFQLPRAVTLTDRRSGVAKEVVGYKRPSTIAGTDARVEALVF